MGNVSMKFEDFVRRGMVKKLNVDKNLAKSLVGTVEFDLKFLTS